MRRRMQHQVHSTGLRRRVRLGEYFQSLSSYPIGLGLAHVQLRSGGNLTGLARVHTENYGILQYLDDFRAEVFILWERYQTAGPLSNTSFSFFRDYRFSVFSLPAILA